MSMHGIICTSVVCEIKIIYLLTYLFSQDTKSSQNLFGASQLVQRNVHSMHDGAAPW